jgi:hypothetical protein
MGYGPTERFGGARVTHKLAGLCFFAVVAAASVATLADQAWLFDKPVLVQKIPTKTDTGSEITCTYYPDLMIRESGTNTPSPNNAVLIRGLQPPCNPTAVGITLKTAAAGLTGRKGPFLLFQATDANGASAFIVIDAETGRTIYQDGLWADNGIHEVTVENGSLHLKFRRAVNGSCSILKEGGRCWAKFVAEGKVPRAMAQTTPPVQACAVSYQQSKVQPDDPSEIFYDVDMTLDRSGRSQVLSRGTVGCVAMP